MHSAIKLNCHVRGAGSAIMTSAGLESATARKVHAMLLEARSQSGDVNLAAVLELASGMTGPSSSTSDRTGVVFAIRTLYQAMQDHIGAAENERLLRVIAAAQHWVRCS
jgi:hypothetical protein